MLILTICNHGICFLFPPAFKWNCCYICMIKHNRKIQSMVTVGGKQSASKNHQQAGRRAEKCCQSSLNKRLLSCSCQLQSVTCFLYLKQDTFTSRGACRGSEDYLSSGNTCYWLTCMLLAWLTATMIIATPPSQRLPWSEGCTFYGCLSIMYPFSSTSVPEDVIITGSQRFSHGPR